MSESNGSLTLPRLFSNGMVLQRNETVPIWGWAAPGEQVTVFFAGGEYPAQADECGRWQVSLPPQKPGGPFTLEVRAQQTLTLQDVWVGDVWMCTGQSNMVLPMSRVRPLYEEDIALSYNLGIRFFTIPERCEFNAELEDFSGGQWQWAYPESVLNFGAVAYFFARTLFEQYHVPIGIINASYGGSSVEAWMSRQALRNFPHYLETADRFQNDEYCRQLQSEAAAASSSWYTRLHQADLGLQATPQWSAENCDDSNWSVMTLPGRWADAQPGDVHGAVWFRREFDIPKELAGKPAQLLMGRIIDSDTVYLNGILVGTTAYQYPPRRYAIPGGILKAGRNVMAVRVVNTEGRGGFGEGKPYKIILDGQTVIDLTGWWRFRVGAVAPALPQSVWFNKQPTSLYNGMLSPAVGYTIKGFAWYQGESNTDRPYDYQILLEEMIADWRTKWGHPELPFLIVQLPNFLDENPALTEGWPKIREAQRNALRIPNTGLVVTIDVGEWNDLHPLNKKPIGQRLARLARKLAYEEELIASGPLALSAQQKNSTLVISFSPDCGGLASLDGDPLQGFEIADENGVFVPANARIDGDNLVAWNDSVPTPKVVRYAWSDNPVNFNLCSSTGLPASPFSCTVE